MEVRKIDYEKDLEEIVQLFNRSFPTKIDKEYFIWKHMENPFGRSYGLLAVEDDKIVGLRMFMRWEFKKDGELLKGIRPVDTCTDPDYRGKGIFKELTLRGLEETKGQYDVIFNTPNSNSIGGYLKMGWKKFPAPIQYRLGLVNPLTKRKSFEIIRGRGDRLQPRVNKRKKLHTSVSKSYFEWRYKAPRYKIARFLDKTVAVYQIKKIKKFKVLVVMEIVGAKEKLHNYINSVAVSSGAYLIYYLKNEKLRKLDLPVSLDRGTQDVVIKDAAPIAVKELDFTAGDLEGIM